jgi:uroporphyrinogen-III decarboxylase
VMLFDTWGGVLTPAQYEEFSLRYMAQVIDALTRKSEGRRVPNIVFTKGGGAWLAKIAAIGCDAVGVDWTTDMSDARQAVAGRVALQGNLDPSALFATPATLRTETFGCWTVTAQAPGMCSIWGTALRRMSIRNASRCSSRRCRTTKYYRDRQAGVTR